MKTKGLIKLLIGMTLATSGFFALNLGNKNNAITVEATYSQGDVVGNNKARIWIGYDTSNPFYSYADANTGIRLWIHENNSGGDELVYGTITGTFDNGAQSNRRYDYFDVDLSVYTNSWYMTVQKFQNNTWKAQTNPIQLSSSNACQVYFIWGDWAWDKTQGTVAAGSIDSVDAGLAAKALGGIHTCSSSNINGYNAFSNYNSTFVKDGDNWKTVGNLSDYTLNDFANGNTSYSGTPATETNAYDKYVKIEALAAGRGVHSSKLYEFSNKTSSTVAVVVISLVSATAIGGYFFNKKRQEN